MIRNAELGDIPALVAMEERSFDSDRLSRRNFRHLLTRGKAACLVEEEEGRIRGYVMLLFHSGTSLARLYSLAVDPEHRGQGIGEALLKAAEACALERDNAYLRLEVRPDNHAAIRLYEQAGYRVFDQVPDYYEDHSDALRLEKLLAPRAPGERTRVPYYAQTLNFTCGPAAMMMAMKALNPDLNLDRKLELRLWREATTIFMTSGHGGCGPYGMALSVWRRGYGAELFISDPHVPFIDSVRSEEKKEVIRLVQEDLFEEIAETDIKINIGAIGVPEIVARFEAGQIPVVLVSSWRMYGEHLPHWVVVNGVDQRFIYVHDPFIDFDEGKTSLDCMNVPILKSDFERMSRYGKARLQATLFVSQRRDATPCM